MRRVYFIKPVGMDGPVKIGCSAKPPVRRATLAAWSPFPLEIAAEIEGDLYLEARFHKRFIAARSHAEWFMATPELLSTIEQIKAGTFDCDTLPPFSGHMASICAQSGELTENAQVYAELVEAYKSLPRVERWKFRDTPVAIGQFAKLGDRAQGRHIERLRHFMATYRPKAHAA